MVGEFLRHTQCDKCGSSDGNAEYTDNYHCFVCDAYVKKESTTVTEENIGEGMETKLSGLRYQALPSRALTEESCRIWKYGVNVEDSTQVANYYDVDGSWVCAKIRAKDKKFKMIGDTKKAPLYGQWLWNVGDNPRRLTIVEGELDAISVAQINEHKPFPVVSVPNGSQSAKAALQRNFEWVNKFESIVLCFDMDEPGQKAAVECAALFGSKAKICKLPLKDANEMLVANRGAEFVKAAWNADTFRPDGIVRGNELLGDILSYGKDASFELPWLGLNQILHGIRKNEVLTIVAGTGCGKSQVCREIAHHLMGQNLKVGYIALEETPSRSMLGFMSIEANEPLHLGDHSDEKLTKFFAETVKDNNIILYDHWGSTDTENLIERIKYMVVAEECDFIILDHLSIVVSGQSGGDERRNIDNTMTALRTVTQEIGCGMILVNHLRRPMGGGDKGYEDGMQPTLSAVRGSAAVAQLSDSLISLARDQQGDTPHISEIRVLKNRYSGETGFACHLHYDIATARLKEDSMGDFSNDF